MSTIKFLLSRGKDARDIKNENHELPIDLARWTGLSADIPELAETSTHKHKKACNRSLGSLSSHETMNQDHEKCVVLFG